MDDFMPSCWGIVCLGWNVIANKHKKSRSETGFLAIEKLDYFLAAAFFFAGAFLAAFATASALSSASSYGRP